MRQSDGKTRIGKIVKLIAIASAVLLATAFTVSDAGAQAAGCV